MIRDIFIKVAKDPDSNFYDTVQSEPDVQKLK